MNATAKVGVIGTGTWGIALARMLCRKGCSVTAWSAISQEIAVLKSTHMHPNLPGVEIPAEIRYTESMEEVCAGQDILLFAVPSVYVRNTAAMAAPWIKKDQILVDVAKGMEPDTLMTMTEILADVMNFEHPGVSCRIVALSGPTHAEEVARDLPTTIVSASKDPEASRYVQQVFSCPVMRVYTNPDVKGVELCGALKNIMALASGIATGLGFGDNLRAAIITRGMAEISRLGQAMGCREQTFSGLAGIGDLIVTATSMHSRNNRAGILIGQGKTAEKAMEEVGMVVEGINALPAAMRLREIYQVDMPITEAVHAVVFDHIAPEQMLHSLMERAFTGENF